MKKFALLAMLFILALSVVVFPAAAQNDHSSLAGYFPSDTPLFVAFQTSDSFIQTLDDFATKIGSVFPGGLMPGSFQEMLDQAVTEITPGGTFNTTIRSWMGDSAAIGALKLPVQTSRQPAPALTIALRITDQDKAEAYFDTLPNAERYTLSEGDGYTLYTPDGSMTSDPSYLFRSDVLLITTDENLIQAGGVLTDSLSGNDAFTTALGMLPGDQYDRGGVLRYPRADQLRDGGEHQQQQPGVDGVPLRR